MKNHLFIGAGLAAMVLSTPAVAGDGWYGGLAAGFDHGTGVRFNSPYLSPPSSISAKTSDGPIVVASAGYKWSIGLRMEIDEAYTSSQSFDTASQSINNSITPQVSNVVNKIGGSASVISTDFNILYDFALNKKWSFTVGAGYGLGYSRLHPTVTLTSTPLGVTPQANAGVSSTKSGDLINGKKSGLESQLILGANYSLTPNVDLTLDLRRRSNEINRPFPTSFTALAPAGTDGIYVASMSDVSVMAGVRYYFNSSDHR
jgi:predicted porin